MREYSLAMLLSVPAVLSVETLAPPCIFSAAGLAAAEPGRADTELEKLEDTVKKYADTYYSETQKAGKSVRDYATIRSDIEKVLSDSGVVGVG